MAGFIVLDCELCDGLGGVAAGGGDVRARDLNGLRVRRAEFAEAMELSEGAGLAAFKAGDGVLDGGSFFADMSLVEAEAKVVVEVAIVAVVLLFAVRHGFIGDGGFDGPGAADAPFGDGDALDEMEFEEVGGLEGIDITLLEFRKKLVTFRAEDDSSGGKAVF